MPAIYTIKQRPRIFVPNGHPLRKGILIDFPWVERAGSGTARNLAPNKRNGTYSNTPIWGGSGITLGDASSSRVTISHNAVFNISTGLTIETFLKPTSSDSNCQIIKKDTQYIFRYRDTAQLRCFLWTSTGQKEINYNGITITNNVWYHLVYTYSIVTATMYLYVDGVLVATAAATGTPSTTGNSIGIGAAPGGGENADHTSSYFRMWGRGMIAKEVQQLYNNPWCLYKDSGIVVPNNYKKVYTV